MNDTPSWPEWAAASSIEPDFLPAARLPAIRLAGDFVMKPGSGLAQRDIPDYELLYFPEGTGTVYQVGERSYTLSQPCFILTRPGEVHSYRYDGHKPTRHLFIHFWPRSLPVAALPLLLPGGPAVIPYEGEFLLSLMKQIVSIAHASPERLQKRGSLLLLTLLSEIHFWHADGGAAGAAVRLPPQVELAVSLIDHTLPAPLTVEELAQKTGWTPEHLSRTFVRYVGCTPKEMMTRRRIDLACQLLLDGQKSIKEIAFEAGFTDQNYFCRVFKATKAITASEYRSKHYHPRYTDLARLPTENRFTRPTGFSGANDNDKRRNSRPMNNVPFPFRTSLNASTLFPYKLNMEEQIRIAAEAGYDGIEIWIRDLLAYTGSGRSAAQLRQLAEQAGIEIAGAISFIPWADRDEAVRAEGRRQAEEELAMLAELGCPAFAAPPFGNVRDMPPAQIAAYYAELAEQAKPYGITPILEFWGRSPVLATLGEALDIASLSGLPQVPLLLDPFHLYTGGSNLADLSRLSSADIGMFHANDYAAVPPKASITDADRLFPGDGIAPSAALAAALAGCGYRGFVSLELFAADYEGRTALETARYGLAKMKTAYAV
ncbi:TIM barrel protein [Paenibacillus protaetiae]|uniref:Helix-turn-helix domain-containing protein n=1 Tax=Paenibacillus protaetiae TaxID=2509456 RepID=A0A4P6F937_9BACL|nr:TIM barrel protein [Paenibacillus protaetiae]QAY66978.1 helix-turn-helix domain-containing protein [Paenibacillus protaetiae]